MDRFTKSYVINLERRSDRLENFKSRIPFDYKQITRFTAIDGQLFPNNCTILNNSIKSHPESRVKSGEIGCLLSHYYIWKEIADNHKDTTSGNDLYLIFEDDVFFSSNFNDKLENTIKNVNNCSTTIDGIIYI